MKNFFRSLSLLTCLTLTGCNILKNNFSKEHTHDFGAPTFDWSNFDLDRNNGEVYAVFKCKSCDKKIIKLAEISSDIHTSCVENGYKKYTAVINSSTYGNYSDIKQINYDSVTGHDLVKINRSEATCQKTGNIEFYSCRNCQKNFLDSEGKNEVNDVVISKKQHKMQLIEEKEKTCLEDGNIRYYHCSECNFNFLDLEGKNPIDNPIIKGGHIIVEHQAREATCCVDGCIHYFECKVCGQAFEDENATKIIEANVIIEKLNHEMTYIESNQISCSIPYSVAHYHCSKCNFDYEDENGNNRLNTVNVEAHNHALDQNHICLECGLEIGELDYSTILRDLSNLTVNQSMSAPNGFNKIYTYNAECGGDNAHLFFKSIEENQPLENVIKFSFGFETDRNYIYYIKSRLNGTPSISSNRIPFQDYSPNSDPVGFVVVTFTRENVSSHTWKITSTKPSGNNAGPALNCSVTISEDRYFNDLFGVCNITNQNPSASPNWRLFNITEIIYEKVIQ